MIHNLFSLPIYKTRIDTSCLNVDDIKSLIKSEHKRVLDFQSPLESNGGTSTYSINAHLHKNSLLTNLNSIIKNHVSIYWKILDIDDRLQPRIDQCWSNIHIKESHTLQHSHSLMPVVATFYLQAENDSGNLILINPMEYSLTHIPYSVPIERKTETEIPVATGDLILFPGWIRHRTGLNRSDSERIVISYNLGYSGKYLNSESDYPNSNMHFKENSEISFLNNKIANLEFIIDNLKRNLVQ